MRIPSIYWLRLTWAAVAVAFLALPFVFLAPRGIGGLITSLAMAMSLLGLWGMRRNDPTAASALPRWVPFVCVGVLAFSVAFSITRLVN